MSLWTITTVFNNIKTETLRLLYAFCSLLTQYESILRSSANRTNFLSMVPGLVARYLLFYLTNVSLNMNLHEVYGEYQQLIHEQLSSDTWTLTDTWTFIADTWTVWCWYTNHCNMWNSWYMNISRKLYLQCILNACSEWSKLGIFMISRTYSFFENHKNTQYTSKELTISIIISEAYGVRHVNLLMYQLIHE